MNMTKEPLTKRVAVALSDMKIMAMWYGLLLLLAAVVLWKPVMWLLLILEVKP